MKDCGEQAFTPRTDDRTKEGVIVESIVQGIELPGEPVLPARVRGNGRHRICDVLLSAMALLVLAPFLAFRAIQARRSCGKAVVSTSFVGRHGKSISVYSFADHAGSCDSLTMWNILIGDMSLVGPRLRTPPEIACSLARGSAPGAPGGGQS